MNKIKFLDKNKSPVFVEITQTHSIINNGVSGRVPTRREAFILARRKGWSHPKMYKGSATSYPKVLSF